MASLRDGYWGAWATWAESDDEGTAILKDILSNNGRTVTCVFDAYWQNLMVGSKIGITGSDDNDGVYTVESVVEGTDTLTITIDEDLQSSSLTGHLFLSGIPDSNTLITFVWHAITAVAIVTPELHIGPGASVTLGEEPLLLTANQIGPYPVSTTHIGPYPISETHWGPFPIQ